MKMDLRSLVRPTTFCSLGLYRYEIMFSYVHAVCIGLYHAVMAFS